MGSRDDYSHHHQPYLSSLVVRPSVSGGGGGAGGSDYEPGEVRRDPRPYSRGDRYSDEPGYRARAVSVSPVRRREIDRRYSPELDRSRDDSPPRRDFGGGRGAPRSPRRPKHYSPPRHKHYSPPRRGGRGGRGFGRGFGGPGFGRGGGRGEDMHKNTNVQPREGDWFCSDPMCGNLNFARRESCNKCKRHRYAPPDPPPRRGGYGDPPPPAMGPPPRRFFPGPPMDRSPGRFMDGYISPPPRGWPRDGPRDFGPGGGGPPPPPRHGGRFPDHHLRRDHHRLDHPEEDFRDRGKFNRPPSPEWGPIRDHGKDSFMDRKSYERRPVSPLPGSPPAGRGRWAERDFRERSRSPGRGAGPPQKDFRREPYMGRGRDERRGVDRDVY